MDKKFYEVETEIRGFPFYVVKWGETALRTGIVFLKSSGNFREEHQLQEERSREVLNENWRDEKNF